MQINKLIRWILLPVFINLWACTPRERDQPAYEVAEIRTIRSTLLAHGVLRSAATVQVKSTINGVIVSLKKGRGDYIRKGEILAELDAKDRQSEFDEQKVITDIACLKASLARNAAQTDSDQPGAIKMEIAQKEAEVEAIRLERKSRRLAECVITAPVSGVIVALQVKEGESVFAVSGFGQGTVLAEISDSDAFVAELNVDEVAVARIGIGQKTNIRFDAIPGMTASGRVTKIGDALRTQSRSGIFPVTVEFKAPNQTLKDGMSATVSIETGLHERVVSVSIPSIRYDDTVPFLKVLNPENGEERRHDINLGLDDGRYVEIISGLNAGELVLAN